MLLAKKFRLCLVKLGIERYDYSNKSNNIKGSLNYAAKFDSTLMSTIAANDIWGRILFF